VKPKPPAKPGSPWAAIDAAKADWERQRRDIDDQLVAAGVRARRTELGRAPIVMLDEHGVLVARLGPGVVIIGRTASDLLASVPRGLERLKVERKARKAHREQLRAARAERAAQLESNRRESVGGQRMSPKELSAYAKAHR
jgi:hypothetical protein